MFSSSSGWHSILPSTLLVKFRMRCTVFISTLRCTPTFTVNLIRKLHFFKASVVGFLHQSVSEVCPFHEIHGVRFFYFYFKSKSKDVYITINRQFKKSPINYQSCCIKIWFVHDQQTSVKSDFLPHICSFKHQLHNSSKTKVSYSRETEKSLRQYTAVTLRRDIDIEWWI